jgi:hypothetical protein
LLDDFRYRLPACMSLRSEFPPRRVNTKVVESALDIRNRVFVASEARRRRDDFEQQVAPERYAIGMQLPDATLLLQPELQVVVGMIEDQSFDDLRGRPFEQRQSHAAARIKFNRA